MKARFPVVDFHAATPAKKFRVEYDSPDPLIQLREYRRLGESSASYQSLRLRISKPSPLPRDIRPASNVHPLFQNLFRTMGLAA